MEMQEEACCNASMINSPHLCSGGAVHGPRPLLPVLHGDNFLLELLGDIDKLQGLLDFAPHVLHLSLHRRDCPFCFLKLSLLGVDLINRNNQTEDEPLL